MPYIRIQKVAMTREDRGGESPPMSQEEDFDEPHGRSLAKKHLGMRDGYGLENLTQ